MNAKPQIDIFGDFNSSKTMGNKGATDFSLNRKNDTTILAKDLLPLHNRKDDRFQTDIQLNGKTKFEESNTIIKSLEEEIVSMKHKLSFVYEKDKEIGKLKEQINELKKENKGFQRSSQECNKLRMETKQLKDQLDLLSMKGNQNDTLLSQNRLLKDKINELTNDEAPIEEIIEPFHDSEDDSPDEMMDVDIHQLRRVLLTRLQDKQTKHIEGLINSYNLRKKNKVKKSILEKMLEEAIHL